MKMLGSLLFLIFAVPALCRATPVCSELFRPDNFSPLQERVYTTKRSLEKYPEELKFFERNIEASLRSPQFTPLVDAIKKSGLSENVLAQMAKNSKGLISIEEMLKMNTEDAAAVGIANNKGMGYYLGIAEAKKMTVWQQLYMRYELEIYDPDPEAFMRRTTNDFAQVIFFIPDHFLDYEHSVTGDEFAWLLENTTAMKNVYFVFGAYNLFPYLEVPPDAPDTSKNRPVLSSSTKYLIRAALEAYLKRN